MEARRIRRLAGLAVVLSLCATALASAQPGEVANPFSVGPSTLPAQVIADCKARPDWTPAHCLAMSGYPNGPREDADQAAEAAARGSQFACMPQMGNREWRVIKPTRFERGPDIPGVTPTPWWHSTTFLLKLDKPPASDPPPETLTVRTVTDLDFWDMRGVVTRMLQAQAPHSDSCERPVNSHDYRFSVHDGIITGGFDVTAGAAQCGQMPCMKTDRCVLGVCGIPYPSTCEKKVTLGTQTVGVDVDIVPAIQGNDLVFKLNSRFDDRGGPPQSLRMLGDLERLWNAATFNAATFRSNNYGVALEQFAAAAEQVAAMSGEIMRQRVNVPGLQAYRFRMENPRFYTVQQAGAERVRMTVDAQGDVPASLACPVSRAMAQYNNVQLGGR
jgi:hypothetical protein